MIGGLRSRNWSIATASIAFSTADSGSPRAICISQMQSRERSYQHLMRAYAATGDKTRAINAYHQLNKLLADELGSNPSPETEALYLALLQ